MGETKTKPNKIRNMKQKGITKNTKHKSIEPTEQVYQQ